MEQAQDIEWMAHRASLISDGDTKGVLKRHKTKKFDFDEDRTFFEVDFYIHPAFMKDEKLTEATKKESIIRKFGRTIIANYRTKQK